ncbi:hypothetical protein EMIT048CA2_280051 [Pseudomonas chlororaphis]
MALAEFGLMCIRNASMPGFSRLVGAKLARDGGDAEVLDDRIIVHREQASLPQKGAYGRSRLA